MNYLEAVEEAQRKDHQLKAALARMLMMLLPIKPYLYAELQDSIDAVVHLSRFKRSCNYEGRLDNRR